MNTISFQIQFDPDINDSVVIPVIDGVALNLLLKKHEAPFAEREGHPDLAGQYGGVPLSEIKEVTSYFLGEAVALYFGEDENKVAILDCTCGSSGCWPFLVRITRNESTITWSHFEQPHRSRESASSFWDFSALPNFEFEITQYLEALKTIHAAA